MPLRLRALATLASLFFIAQQVHPSFGLGILSSPFSECCAPGFVQLSLSCHSGLISNVSFPPFFHIIPFSSPRPLFQITFAIPLSSQSCRTLSLLGVSYLPEMPVPGYVMIPGTL